MSKKHENLDNISLLYQDLQNEIEADKLYWIRNDAKVRAITTSKTYDEFRNIVDAAHLKPVSREDIKSMGNNSKNIWNKALK